MLNNSRIRYWKIINSVYRFDNLSKQNLINPKRYQISKSIVYHKLKSLHIINADGTLTNIERHRHLLGYLVINQLDFKGTFSILEKFKAIDKMLVIDGGVSLSDVDNYLREHKYKMLGGIYRLNQVINTERYKNDLYVQLFLKNALEIMNKDIHKYTMSKNPLILSYDKCHHDYERKRISIITDIIVYFLFLTGNERRYGIYKLYRWGLFSWIGFTIMAKVFIKQSETSTSTYACKISRILFIYGCRQLKKCSRNPYDLINLCNKYALAVWYNFSLC